MRQAIASHLLSCRVAGVPELVYNPYAFSLHEDPYVVYRRLRDEAPVYWNPELEFWALSRFDDVHEGFRDHATLSSANGVALENRGRVGDQFRQMIEMDPPEHSAFRQLVSRVFTGRRVAEMEAQIRTIVSGYLDAVTAKGEADLVAEVTGPFPMDVISVVLGIPEGDRAELRRHADEVMVRDDGKIEMPKVALDGMLALVAYFAEDLRGRRPHVDPGLISEFLELKVDGRSLTKLELLGFCTLFVIAGHETTTKMVANAVELLDRHPDQRRQLIDDPTLIPAAVEEVLRFHNSTQYMHRTLTRDIERHGQIMREGQSVLLVIGAANHDEREFGPTAENFDIHRRAERHLAFGYGAHFCLGAALARMEGRVALEEIHRRIPDYVVDRDRARRFHSGNVTGWTSLPITFTPQYPAV
ncbi:MAG: cytochrome P450 [Acidimicrobiia bacterium]|nr:cytochrome P450 [Acidimicrobiia bacterium]